MGTPATFGRFQTELGRLVSQFERNRAGYQQAGYDETSLRNEFLNPLFEALGWDVSNRAGLAPHLREVRVEARGAGAARQKRADYEFRLDRQEKFICEAKRPYEQLAARHIFQAKSYAWNRGLALAVLTDFEEFKVYVVGGRPDLEKPEHGEYRVWGFAQYPLVAQEIWDLFARDNVAAGSIDKLIESLPKKPLKGKARQQWLIKPDRTRAVDADFLDYLDDVRRELASDLYRHTPKHKLEAGAQLNEAVQRILDRILFLRICEDRDIDTGRPLARLLEDWLETQPASPLRPRAQSLLHAREEPAPYPAKAPPAPFYQALVGHFRALDRRPPGHVPFFNGQLFKPHFSEDLEVSDDFLANFIRDISADDSPYLFNSLPVEILGSVYERFIGKIVRPRGVGVTVEEKPEVRKAGGVYYTPRYIVDYIVEQTVGQLLKDKSPKEVEKLRILDPACGSGSFLIRAYERVMEHHVEWLLTRPKDQRPELCYTDANGDLQLTTTLKRRILTNNIFGVDIDGQAVEVTQLSLYLRMLQGETQQTMTAQREMFGDAPILPPLDQNIKQGNSLIASDFSMLPDDLVRVHAFDWNVGFRTIMDNGGFDAVIGNPPYVRIQTLQETEPQSVAYLNGHYVAAAKGNYDIYVVFVERALSLLSPSGRLGYILPHKFFTAQYGEALRAHLAAGKHLLGIVHFGDQQVFEGATTYTCLLLLTRKPSETCTITKVTKLAAWRSQGKAERAEVKAGQITSAQWNFSIGPAGALVAKLTSQQYNLGAIADRMAQGIRTSANEVYVLDIVKEGSSVVTAESEILGSKVTLEAAALSRFLQGRDIKRYALQDSAKVVIIPYGLADGQMQLISETEFRRKLPRAYSYLLKNRKHLESRERGRMRGAGWWGFVYPKNIEVMRMPKILVPDIADAASFAFDEKGRFAFTSGYAITLKPCIPLSPKFVLGLLNSALLDFFLKRISTTMRGGFFRFFTQYIEKLPIVMLDLSKASDRAAHDRLVSLVDKMLGLMPKLRAAKTEAARATLANAVAATDRAIDGLVYELYGLTAEEIKLVEESAAK